MTVNTTQSEDPGVAWGVYGLRIDAPSGLVDPSLVVTAQPSWPVWTIVWEPTPPSGAEPVVESWSPDMAVLAAQPEGRITVDRSRARTTLQLPDPPTPASFLHPYLASTAVVANHWLGRAPFHAGSFAYDGRIWGVLGTRETGKSSLLMCLHAAGVQVLGDDVLVVDGAIAFAGPRCLDLRRSAADHFGSGEYLGVVGTRERWRVTLPPAPSQLPFGGWILPDWSDRIAVGRTDTTTKFRALVDNAGLTAPGVPTPGLLDLVTYPMLHFSRPRDWTRADEALEHLLLAVATVNPHAD